jgi:hypothetical protein
MSQEERPGKAFSHAAHLRPSARRARLSEYSSENSEKASLQLHATAEHGDAVNDYGSPIVREASSRSATLRDKVGDGPTIKVTSQRGWISVS